MSSITSIALFITGLLLFFLLPTILFSLEHKHFDHVFQSYIGLGMKTLQRGVLLDEDYGPFSLHKTKINEWGVQEFEHNDEMQYKEDNAGLTKHSYGAQVGLTTSDTMSMLSARLAEVAEFEHEKARDGDHIKVESKKERTEEIKRDVVKTKERVVETNTKVKLPKDWRLVDLSYLPPLLRRFTEPGGPAVMKSFVEESQSHWSDVSPWEAARTALMFIVAIGGVWFLSDQVGSGGGGGIGYSVPIWIVTNVPL